MHCQLCKGIVTVSKASSDALRQLFPRCPILGITGEGFSTQFIVRRPIDVPNDFVLVVSTEEPRKNLRAIIQAFEASGAYTEHHTSLVVVGRHGWGPEYTETVQGVHRVGYISDPELWWLYQNAKGLVFAPFEEGFGLPALEASSQHCPVLASNIPVLKELGGDAFLYCDPFDVNSIASGISALIKNGLPTFDRVDAMCRRYSWTASARRLADILKAVSESGSARSL